MDIIINIVVAVISVAAGYFISTNIFSKKADKKFDFQEKEFEKEVRIRERKRNFKKIFTG